MRRIRESDQEIEEKSRNRAKVEEEESMPDAKLRDDRHPEELHAGMKEMKDKFDEHARRMATARKEFEDKFALRQKEIEERMEHILNSLSFGAFVCAGTSAFTSENLCQAAARTRMRDMRLRQVKN